MAKHTSKNKALPPAKTKARTETETKPKTFAETKPKTFAETVEEVMVVCQPEKALLADDPRWEDFTSARGDRSVALIERRLRYREPTPPIHLAFLSHRGAGKTTELRRLEGRLSDRYCTLYLEANVEMDPYEVEAEDLFLVLARAVEVFMRERKTPLPSKVLEDVTAWFSEVVASTEWGNNYSAQVSAGATAEASVPFFAKLTASFTSLFKVESKHRQEVKSLFKKYPGELLRAVNGLLDAAAEKLRSEGLELLVVIDNLDRYSPEVIDRLLIGSADRIRSLHCCLLLTPPISLAYRPKTGQLDDDFQCEVMHTVRLRTMDQPYNEFEGPGRNVLLQALKKRMDIDLLMPEPKARDRIIVASGGAIRDLLDLVAEASLMSNGPTITIQDVERAISRKRGRLRDMINTNGYWSTLARIAKEKQIFDGEKCLEVLFLRLAFKYNGQVWYDVHPLVTEIPEFEAASRALVSTSDAPIAPAETGSPMLPAAPSKR